MLKLLSTIVVFLLLALSLLWLRMQRWELTAQTAGLRQEIVQREHQLWGQDYEIAKRTNPPQLVEELKNSGLILTLPGTPSEALKATKKTNNDNGGDDRDLLAPLRRGHRTTTGRHP